MNSFKDNRKFIENEFENARFDEATGKSCDELFRELSKMQEQSSFSDDRERFCAEAYAYLLRNMQLEINEHTPFSVKFNIGVNYSGFASIDVYDKALFRRQREKVLSEKLPLEYEKMRELNETGVCDIYTDFWHTVPDWDNLISRGFSGILEYARERRAALLEEGDERGVRFLSSVIIRYEAILECLERIYSYSLGFAVSEFSGAVKRLIANPPKTLYEVMLFSVLYLYFEEIGPERGRTLGPIDRLYYPFYKAALSEGRTLEEIKELFRYFFIHFTATKRFAQQPFLLCGSDIDGGDRTNELSHLILDVYDEMNILDPKIHVRYHSGIDAALFRKVVDMIRRGHSSICVVNDGAVLSGYEKIGIKRADAVNYVLLGCYEPVIMGLEEAEVGVAWINGVKPLEYLLRGGRDGLTGRVMTEVGSPRESFEEFFAAYLAEVDKLFDFAIDFAEKQSEYNILMNPSPIYSSSFSSSIEKGRDVHEYAVKYNNMSLKYFGLGTAVDSLTAIKKYVFDEKEISLAELSAALEKNFEGYGRIRTRIMNDPDKYGNGRRLPDEIMKKITSHLEERYVGRTDKSGRKIRLGLDSIDTHLYRGERTAATPDGRLSGQPLSRNLAPTSGMDRAGITGYMSSVLKINTEAFLNSAIFDFVLHPSAVEGEKGLSDFTSLCRIFFEQGGFAMQGNVVNRETLLEAQREPEKYSTLQIRVCGWNEYFVRMPKSKQDYFIASSEK